MTPIESRKNYIFLLVICLLLLLFQAVQPAAARTLRIGVYCNKPLVFQGEDGSWQGLCVDLLKDIAAREGWELEYVPGTWSQCLQRLKSGQLDLQVAIAWSAERARFFSFTSEPVFTNWGTIYVRPDSPIKSIVDLKNKTVATLENDIHRQVFADLLQRFQITCRLIDAQHYDEVFSLLEKGQVDAGLVNRLYGSTHEGCYAVERTAMIINPIKVSFAAPLGQKKVLAVIDGQLVRMKKEAGSAYYRIMDQWLGAAVPPKEILPLWVLWVLGVVLLFSLFFLSANAVLKRQITARTAELKRANDNLQKSQETLSLALKGADLVLWNWNIITNDIQVNDRWYTMLGYDPGEFPLSYTIWENLVHPDDIQRVLEKIQQHLQEVNRSFYQDKYRLKCKDGSWLWIQSRGRILEVGDDHKPVRAAGIHQDITREQEAEAQHKRLESQMQQAQKLESLGVLAGGIAHDFNNILTAILGNHDLALTELSPSSPVAARIASASKAARRAADLAQQMLAYSGKGKFFIADIDLNELVADMGHLLQVSIAKQVVLQYHLAKNLPAVSADVSQLRQVIMNLITNAAEAIGKQSGVVNLTTGAMDASRGYLRESFLDENQPEGLYVYLEVSDTGCGMDNETISHIFDPFFTTKFTGRGLGMAAVLGIVRGHHGAVKVYSEPGKGTTFKVLFPAVSRDAVTLNHRQQGEENWRGSGTILLVDDEETLRALGKEMLENLGFTVLLAEDGEQALEVYRRHMTEIKCVILDLTMPHMGGEQAFRELRQLNKDIKVIIASGYSESDIKEKFLGKGLAGVLQKPYLLTDLQNILRSIIQEV
ncbi:MAG: transporter substrate-binding domain-containing protein [Xanthomonadaceae bacterium]|nr:transporter substrate-binding domain-containing protein [Xanthomonadaceae bacterium]